MSREAQHAYGQVCEKHPELRGLRYATCRSCVECKRESSRSYAKQKRAEGDRRFLIKHRLASARYRQRNCEVIRQKTRERNRHPAVLERKNSWLREARRRDPERFRWHDRKKYRRHQDKIKQRNRLRESYCKQQTPTWANPTVIDAIYAEARRTNMTVDHIVPLRGTNVCGLHVENNMQLLSRVDNARKGNRFME